MTLEQAIGHRVRQLRFLGGEQRLSQADMATKLGIQASELSRIETGKKLPKTETLIKLKGLTGFPLDCLLGTRKSSTVDQLAEFGAPLESLLRIYRSHDAETRKSVTGVIANTERLMSEQFRDAEFMAYLRHDPKQPLPACAFDEGRDAIELRQHALDELVRTEVISQKECGFLKDYFHTHKITQQLCKKHPLSSSEAIEIRQRFAEGFAREFRERLQC